MIRNSIDRRLLGPAGLALLMLLALFLAVPARAASPLTEGDILIPGDGCIWILGSPTPWITSNVFHQAGDAMEDDQGRIVFIARPYSSDENDLALFRADPTSGTLERLLILRAQIASGDTIPDHLPGGFGFQGEAQSLHLVKTYDFSVVDSVNKGVPQVGTTTNYAFSVGVIPGIFSQSTPVEIRWRENDGTAEVGTDFSPAGVLHFPLPETQIGTDTMYGAFDAIYQCGPQLNVHVHFSAGSLGTVDARLQVTLSNGLMCSGVEDDLKIPNVTADCNGFTFEDIPMVNGGFNSIAVGTLGNINGSLFASTNSGVAGTPFEIGLSPRAAFMNPNCCCLNSAVKMASGTIASIGDTLGLWNLCNSGDGSNIYANVGGPIVAVSSGGSVGLLGSTPSTSGRPVRWHSPSAPFAAARAQAAAPVAADTTLNVLAFRVDSLVRIMVTDPNGLQIGVTPGDTVINAFGTRGKVASLGPSGWPKLITLLSPRAGLYRVDLNSTTDGQYGVIGYLAETGTGGVNSATNGTITAGPRKSRYLDVEPALTLQWLPETAGVEGQHDPEALGFDWIGPLPASNLVRFGCRVSQRGEVKLEIFDVSGRRVATPVSGVREAGAFTSVWSGRADDGQLLEAGVYLARLTMPGASAARRVVLIR